MKDPAQNSVDFKYLMVNDRDWKYPLTVHTVGYQEIRRDTPYPLQEHPSGYYFNIGEGRILREYQLLYITEGEGFFSSKHVHAIPVRKGSVIFLFPGEWHTYHPVEETGWTEYYIGFQGDMVANLIRNEFLSVERPVLFVGEHEMLVELFLNAIQVAKSDKIASQQYLAGIVMHMLGMIMSFSKTSEFEANDLDQKIERAKIVMNRHLLKSIDLQQLAAELNLSYSWFRKIFKDYTGYAPAKYFQELKLRKAKESLIHTSANVKEISFMLGFHSVEHFSLTFKKRTGMTPLEYRAYGRGRVL